jgi:hypothetical protein
MLPWSFLVSFRSKSAECKKILDVTMAVYICCVLGLLAYSVVDCEQAALGIMPLLCASVSLLAMVIFDSWLQVRSETSPAVPETATSKG